MHSYFTSCLFQRDLVSLLEYIDGTVRRIVCVQGVTAQKRPASRSRVAASTDDQIHVYPSREDYELLFTRLHRALNELVCG